MCLLSPRKVGPGAEASPRARRGHSRHTASDCVTLGAVYSSPVRLWDAYVRREGAQPRTGQRPREDRRVRGTGFGAESAQQSVPTAGRGRTERRLALAEVLDTCWCLGTCSEELSSSSVTLGNLLNLPEPECLGL